MDNEKNEDNIYKKEIRDLFLSIKEKPKNNDDFEEDIKNIIKTYRKYKKNIQKHT